MAAPGFYVLGLFVSIWCVSQHLGCNVPVLLGLSYLLKRAKSSWNDKAHMENLALKHRWKLRKRAIFLPAKPKANILIKQKRLLQRATAFRIYPISDRKKVSKNILYSSESKDSFRKDSFQTGGKGRSSFTQDKRDSFRCPSCLWGNHKIK